MNWRTCTTPSAESSRRCRSWPRLPPVLTSRPQFKGSPAINAALISAAQKVEHYEMASYGCLHEWAGLLGNTEAAGLLQEILDQEKAANETLTGLARASSNEEALGESDEKKSAEDSARKATAPRRRAA